MAAVINGTAHLYGVAGTIANCTVLDFQLKENFANKATTENESGNVIERRSDDRTSKVTITLRPRAAYVKPAIGDDLTYDNVVYEIEDITHTQKNKEHRAYTLECITSEGVSLS